MTEQLVRECEWCKKIITVSAEHNEPYKRFYCSTECWDKSHSFTGQML